MYLDVSTCDVTRRARTRRQLHISTARAINTNYSAVKQAAVARSVGGRWTARGGRNANIAGEGSATMLNMMTLRLFTPLFIPGDLSKNLRVSYEVFCGISKPTEYLKPSSVCSGVWFQLVSFWISGLTFARKKCIGYPEKMFYTNCNWKRFPAYQGINNQG